MTSIFRFSYSSFEDEGYTIDHKGKQSVTTNMTYTDAELQDEVTFTIEDVEIYSDEVICEYSIGNSITLQPGQKLSSLTVDIETSIDAQNGLCKIEIRRIQGHLLFFNDNEDEELFGLRLKINISNMNQTNMIKAADF